MKKHHSGSELCGSEWELKWWEGGSEKWGCRLEMEKEWIGEMRVDRRKMSGSVCLHEWIGVRNGKRKLTVSVDWIKAWIVSVECVGADRSVDWIEAWIVLCVEWIGACFVECVEWIRACFVECLEWIGACFVNCVDWIGAWIFQMFGCVDCVELGLWCVGVDRSIWLGVWVGAVKLWERQCMSKRGVRVREKWKTFEVKIWAEIDFRWFWLILRSNWKYFQFDPIYHANQTCYFSENDFRISFSAKTNGP